MLTLIWFSVSFSSSASSTSDTGYTLSRGAATTDFYTWITSLPILMNIPGCTIPGSSWHNIWWQRLEQPHTVSLRNGSSILRGFLPFGALQSISMNLFWNYFNTNLCCLMKFVKLITCKYQLWIVWTLMRHLQDQSFSFKVEFIGVSYSVMFGTGLTLERESRKGWVSLLPWDENCSVLDKLWAGLESGSGSEAVRGASSSFKVEMIGNFALIIYRYRK